jgi:3-methyladenine DNA glycosylase AlkD
LLDKDKDKLILLSKSKIMWERRVAIVATWYFIRNNQLDWTVKIAEILLDDQHDLIHKAVGWMLREVGKKDVVVLKKFLDVHLYKMPRTMLRYAIERFPEEERLEYLKR